MRTGLDEICDALKEIASIVGGIADRLAGAEQKDLADRMRKVEQGWSGMGVMAQVMRDRIVFARAIPAPAALITTIQMMAVAFREEVISLGQITQDLQNSLWIMEDAVFCAEWCSATDEVLTKVWDNPIDADLYNHL